MKPEEAAEAIRDRAAAYGKAKAARVFIEKFMTSKIAILKKQAMASGIKASNAQDREAYADKEYLDLIEALEIEIEKEERLKWELESYRLEIEIWRSREATNRMTDRAHS